MMSAESDANVLLQQKPVNAFTRTKVKNSSHSVLPEVTKDVEAVYKQQIEKINHKNNVKKTADIEEDFAEKNVGAEDSVASYSVSSDGGLSHIAPADIAPPATAVQGETVPVMVSDSFFEWRYALGALALVGGAVGGALAGFSTASASAPAPVNPVHAPVLKPVVDADGTAGSAVTISGTAAASATVKIYDGSTLLATVTADAQGAFTYAAPTTAAGSHSITATATTTVGTSPISAGMFFVNGKVSDGPLSNAVIYNDVNGNHQKDAGEQIAATSDANGNFFFATNTDPSTIKLGAMAGSEVQTAVPNLLQLSAPVGYFVLSPLSTLIERVAAQSGVASVAQAELLVEQALKLDALDYKTADISSIIDANKIASIVAAAAILAPGSDAGSALFFDTLAQKIAATTPVSTTQDQVNTLIRTALTAAGGTTAAEGVYDATAAAIAAAVTSANISGIMASVQMSEVTPATLASLTDTQLGALTKAQIAGLASAAGGLAALSATQIAAVGTDIDALSATQAAALTDVQLAGLSAAQIYALAAVGDLVNLTATQIGAIGADIVGATPAQFAGLSDAQLAGLSEAQLNSLAADGDFVYLTALQMAVLGSAITGVTPAQLATLTNSQLGGLTALQIGALAGNGDLAALSAAQIGAIGDHIAAISPAQCAALSNIQLGGLSAAQIGALATDGDLATLSAPQINAIGMNIAGLNASQTAALTDVQLGALLESQVYALAGHDDLAALSAAQIALLGSNIIGINAGQAAGLTDSQLGGLSAAQIGALAGDGDLASLSALQITALGSHITGLNGYQLAGLNDNQLGGLSAAQIGALAGDGDLAYLGAVQIAALGSHIVGLSVAQLAGLNDIQLNGLSNAQIAIIDLTSLTAHQIATLGSHITGLSALQVAGLSDIQLGGLSVGQIDALAGDGDLAKLSAAQMHLLAQIDTVAPTFTSGSIAAAVDENTLPGHLVYTATTNDRTGGVIFNLETTSGDSGAFSIDHATGAVTLIGSPDFETKANYSFTIGATDIFGNQSGQTVTLVINDLDEIAPDPPTINLVAGNDIIDASEVSSAISGSCEDHATVAVTIAGTVHAATVDGTTWSYILEASDISAMGEGAETITATQSDAAGNTSLAASHTITVDTTSPVVAALVPDVTGVAKSVAKVSSAIDATHDFTMYDTTVHYLLSAAPVDYLTEAAKLHIQIMPVL